MFKWLVELGPLALSNSESESKSKSESPNAGLRVDPVRLFVSGTSAGGYIAYLAALWAEPHPKAVISMYGMGGDFLVSWRSLPVRSALAGVFRRRSICDADPCFLSF